MSSSTSSFSELFMGQEDIFAGLDAISATPASPLDDGFLSLSISGSARSSVIGPLDGSASATPAPDPTSKRTSIALNTQPTTPSSLSSPSSGGLLKNLSYTTPSSNSATPASAAQTSSASSPRSSIQFPRFGSLSRTNNSGSSSPTVASFNATAYNTAPPKSVSPPQSPPATPPVPPTRSSTKNVVASSGIGIVGGSAAAAAAITGKPTPIPSPRPANAPPIPPTSTKPSEDDPQPAKKTINSGQIVNARSLVEESDTVSSVGSAGMTPSGSSSKQRGFASTGDLYDAGPSASGSPLLLAKGRVPGSSSKSGKSRSNDSVPLVVRDANKALAFETLLTTGTTVKLSSTPDRLRSIEITSARKNSTAISDVESTVSGASTRRATPARLQAKEATVPMREDHSLSDFLKNTGPEDPMGRSRSAAGKDATGKDGKPLKGVLKASSSVPPVPVSRSNSTPSVPTTAQKDGASANASATSPAATEQPAATGTSSVPASPAMQRSATSPKATSPSSGSPMVARGGSKNQVDESDSDDELFGRPKKKKDEMSLADFLKYTEPPSSAAAAPEPAPAVVSPSLTRKSGGGTGKGLFSLTRSRNNSAASQQAPVDLANDRSPSGSSSKLASGATTAPDPPRRSRQASDTSTTQAVSAAAAATTTTTASSSAGAGAEADATSPRTRSASQSSMERLVKNMFSGFGGNSQGQGGGEEDQVPGMPPVPAIPPEILARHSSQKGKGAKGVAAATAVKLAVVPSSLEKPLPEAVQVYMEKEAPFSGTGAVDAERVVLARRAAGEIDPEFGKALAVVKDEDVVVGAAKVAEEKEVVLQELVSAGCQTDEEGVAVGMTWEEGTEERRVFRVPARKVEVVDAGSQTIYDVLVVEYEEYMEGDAESLAMDEVVVVEEESQTTVSSPQDSVPPAVAELAVADEPEIPPVAPVAPVRTSSANVSTELYSPPPRNVVESMVRELVLETANHAVDIACGPDAPMDAEAELAHADASEATTNDTTVGSDRTGRVSSQGDHSGDAPSKLDAEEGMYLPPRSVSAHGRHADRPEHLQVLDRALLCEDCQETVYNAQAAVVPMSVVRAAVDRSLSSPLDSPHADGGYTSSSEITYASLPRRLEAVEDNEEADPVYEDSATAEYEPGVRRRREVAGKTVDVRDGATQATPSEHVSEVGVQVCTLPVVPMPMSPYGSMSLPVSPVVGANGLPSPFNPQLLQQHPFGPSSRYSLPHSIPQALAAQLRNLPSSVAIQTESGLEVYGGEDVAVQAGETGEVLEREAAEREGREAALHRKIRELELENEKLRKALVQERGLRADVSKGLVGLVDSVIRREVRLRKEITDKLGEAN
ncbi:hypothetical protein HDU96_009493 [Phlyctochytrium bullatum]|nr:hypothetical protein HDU96_009493 [Phlyctochytrium bullatum]